MSKVNSQFGKGVEICVSWVKASNGYIPPKAVCAGGNCYVARAKHEGQYIPGKLVEGYNGAFVAWGGLEHCKENYEVLISTSVLHHNSLEWKWVSGENLPSGAIVGGADGGNPLYIARTDIDGELVVGKYYPQHGCSYLPYGGEEHRRDGSEVLCCATKHV